MKVVPATEAEVRTGELGRRLRRFNTEHVGPYPEVQPVWINLNDDAGALQGGLRGLVAMHWLRVEVLFVEAAWRGRGWGTQLLAAGEAAGRALGARQAAVETFAWQAPDFYRRLGWTEAACLPDYMAGQPLFIFRRTL